MDISSEQTETSEPKGPKMPDLTAPQFGFRHTVDSALTTLSRIGIALDRITIRKEGPGWREGCVVNQEPEKETVLTADKSINLKIAGDGLYLYLPTGMREAGATGEIGVREVVSLFDDGVEKAAFYVREGGRYFDLRPENRVGCARWIALFGIDADEWPVDSWYKLALLLPGLHSLAGREEGLRLALGILLQLDIASISWLPRQTRLLPNQISRFGEVASHLGTDLIVGDTLEDEMVLKVVLGPVSLENYLAHQTPEGLRSVDQVIRLAVPYHVVHVVDWLVGDSTRAPRLGVKSENSVLGINTHLGEQVA